MGLSSSKLPPQWRNAVADAVLAMPLSVAEEYLKEHDISYRIAGGMTINNFMIDRANLYVENNRVVKITWG